MSDSQVSKKLKAFTRRTKRGALRRKRPLAMAAKGGRLINEAIKRILLDMVIRGHGDRLIGRWSREPELQQFLEQIPYMLDRINQLHLACTRRESLEWSPECEHKSSEHHHYHHHHADTLKLGQSSLNDFVSLVGHDRHWLVRTRDPLGLTPLHKAVLFNNRPIVEYILDRYQDELAASHSNSWQRRASGRRSSSTQASTGQTAAGRQRHSALGATRLIDAQDKYGRTALHYAAAQMHSNHSSPSVTSNSNQNRQQLYHLLVTRGASLTVRDFRGKSAAHYVRHPNQLHARSIIHLANKLTTNYQANVLTKTLRASSQWAAGGPISSAQLAGQEGKILIYSEQRKNSHDRLDAQPDSNRESMSVSCNDLSSSAPRRSSQDGSEMKRSQSSVANLDECDNLVGAPSATRSSLDRAEYEDFSAKGQRRPRCNQLAAGRRAEEQNETTSTVSLSLSSDSERDLGSDTADSAALKRLIADRSPRPVLDERTRQTVRRSLNEGRVERINELMVAGYGAFIVAEASSACWNRQCRRYIGSVVASALGKVDSLHELIAANRLPAMKALLKADPVLARIRRPYRRASMGALHVAVLCNRHAALKYLVRRFPELVSQRDSLGATCLHWAAKSLSHERLYIWLLDNFGSRLEPMRDFRAKTAADYRRQAFKLAQFSETHPTRREHASSAWQMERTTQAASNDLQLAGTRAKMYERQQQQQKVGQKIKRSGGHLAAARSTSQSRTVTPAVEPSAREKSIEININSASTSARASPETQSRATEVGQPRGEPGNDRDLAQQQHNEVELAKGARRVSSAVPAKAAESGKQQARRASDSNATDASKPATPVAPELRVASPEAAAEVALRGDVSQADEIQAESVSSDLLSEMVQLDSEDLRDIFPTTSADDSSFVGPSGATPTSTRPPRPESGSEPHRLESAIIESIRSEDYKKLEHLILAGCGQRVMKVYRDYCSHSADVSSPLGAISGQMRNFLDVHTPNYIEKISQIHKLLHKCYAAVSSETISQEANSRLEIKKTNGNGSDSELNELNSTFHKLCNLLDRKRLIMGRDSFGAGPLHVALMRSDRRLVDYLLRRHPEAASAPDQERRNALHYASLALSVYTHHGTLKLTTESVLADAAHPGQAQAAPAGYWRVDEGTKVIYRDLCARYGELAEAKDKQACSASDYLAKAGQAAAEHIALAAELGTCLVRPQLLARCCPEYAELLSRYNYVIVRDDNEGEPVGGGSEQRRSTMFEAGAANGNADNRPHYFTFPSPATVGEALARPGADHSGQPTRGDSEVAGDKVNHSTGATWSHGDERALTSDTAADSREQLPVGPPGGAAAPPETNQAVPTELPEPPPPTQQVQFAHTPASIPKGPSVEPPSSTTPSSGTSRHRHSSRSPTRRKSHTLLDDFDPSHGRHHVRRHPAGGNRSEWAGPQSLVGGVIVPTIIHNDEMDEIKTYNVIYRQPPANSGSNSRNSPSNQQMGGTNSSTSSLSSSCSDPAEHRHHHHRHRQRRHRRSKHSGSPEHPASSPGSALSSDSELSDEDDEDENDDDEDERVERLSSEFENRVRKEKSELRAKVDQIMNEIKMSAKSGKSSRFLASPSDFNKPGSSNETVMRLSIPREPESNGQSQLPANPRAPQQQGGSSGPAQSVSLSSSGHSSARTSCSSASSLASSASSQTLSCSSSGSLSSSRTASSSCSSASTGNNGAGAGSQRPAKSFVPSAAGSEALSTGDNNTNTNPAPGELVSPSTLAGHVVSKNTYGQTYLHFIASRSQNASTLYKVLDHGRHLIGERDVFYRTARDIALQFNLSNNVQVLDKFIIDQFICANTGLLRHLLNQGYSPLIHVSDPDGNDIMLILKLLKLERMIHFLLLMADFQRWRDELHTFIRNGYSAGVSELIKKHKDLVKAKSMHSRCSLHLAVLFDRTNMVAELLETDPTIVHETDNMGRTALHYTYGLHLKNMEEIRDLLLARGASVEARDVKMRTPKYYYIFKREIEDIKRIELELR